MNARPSSDRDSNGVAVYIARWAVHREYKLNRQQGAADRLIDWVYEASSLAADIAQQWSRTQRGIPQETELEWGAQERRARLYGNRFLIGLPDRLQRAVEDDIHDLTLVTTALYEANYQSDIGKRPYRGQPPPVKGDWEEFGEWLECFSTRLVPILNDFAATGEFKPRHD